MATEVVMPQMGESIAEGTITKWLVKVGDRVERDQPLFEISTDKVDAEIPSPAAGVVLEIRQQEGSHGARLAGGGADRRGRGGRRPGPAQGGRRAGAEADRPACPGRRGRRCPSGRRRSPPALPRVMERASPRRRPRRTRRLPRRHAPRGRGVRRARCPRRCPRRSLGRATVGAARRRRPRPRQPRRPVRLRRGHHRQRPRRLRGRHPRRPARPQGRGGREGPQARRHLPAPRLHPHQGAAAHRRRCSTRLRKAASFGVVVGEAAARRRQGAGAQAQGGRARTPRASRSCSRRTRSSGVSGCGRLAGPHTVRGRRRGRRRADARRASTSCWPRARCRATCRIAKADGKRIVNSDHVLELERVPKSLVVLGAGAVGIEFASIYRSFGSEVTLVEMLPRAAADRGRGGLGRAAQALPQARHRGPDRRQADRGRGGRRRRARSASSTGQGAVDRGRGAAGGRRPRAR